jgi:hypothetical protein
MAVPENNKTLVIDLHPFPSINYYRTLIEHHKLKFEQYEHFAKGSCLNRYYLAGPNGRMLLSIPLLHDRRERTAFRDLKICNRDRWQMLHWRTLVSAYRRSPWFEFYEDNLRGMYERKFEYLMDWNLEAFGLAARWLGLDPEVSFTGSYEMHYPEAEFTDARNRFLPADMEVDYRNAPSYRQVFAERSGFLRGLSILDLVFCEGKRAAPFLQPG